MGPIEREFVAVNGKPAYGERGLRSSAVPIDGPRDWPQRMVAVLWTQDIRNAIALRTAQDTTQRTQNRSGYHQNHPHHESGQSRDGHANGNADPQQREANKVNEAIAFDPSDGPSE